MAMTRNYSKDPVSFRALIPKPLAVKNMIAPIRDACIKDAKDMGKDLEKVTKTWKDDKPRIQTEAKLVPTNVEPSTGFHSSFTASAWAREDNSKGYWKFFWLNYGTKVRYAVMSNPFVAKTTPGLLGSRAGKGGMLFVNKKHPMPGIKARKFTLALRRKWEKPFHDHIAKAVKEAAKASGHGM
jgi:hypothetical protein